MRTLTPLALARELAVQTPEAMVPCPVCAGAVRELRPAGGSPQGSHAAESHHAGTYLQQGRTTRRWDVTLDAADFVALQYALAERGLLERRG